MNPKKKQGEKAKNAGISLEPEIITKARRLAKEGGFKSLSALTYKLLSEALEKAADRAEEKGQRKIRQARGEERDPPK